MNMQLLPRAGAALLGAVLAAGANAQASPERDEPLPSPPGQVLSDAKPLPAEERESAGAIVLRNQPVRARADARLGEGADEPRVDGNVTRVLGGPAAPTDAERDEDDKDDKDDEPQR